MKFRIFQGPLKKLQLKSLGLTVFPNNVRAIGTYEKAGFSTVGILEKSWTMPHGEQFDMLMMELTQEGWLKTNRFVASRSQPFYEHQR